MNIKKLSQSSWSFMLKTLSIIFLLVPATTITWPLPQYAIDELERNMREAIYDLKRLYSRNNFDSFHENLIFSEIKSAFEQIEHRNSEINTITPEDVGKISAADMKKAKQEFYQNLEKESQKVAIEQMEQNNFENVPQVFARHKYLCENVIKAENCDCINGLQITATEYLKNDSEQKKLISEIMTAQTEEDELQKKLSTVQIEQQKLQKKLEDIEKNQQNNLNKIVKQANN